MNVTEYSENIADAENGSFGINIGRKAVKYLIGSVFGMAVVIALTALFSFIMTINAVPDEAVNIFPYIIVVGGAFITGVTAAAKIGLNGMLNGALSGFVFFIIQTLISLLFKNGSIFTSSLLIYLIIDVISGAIGGISAVNIFKTKSR
jgi:putative membrane protein (TIGR04086 family)